MGIKHIKEQFFDVVLSVIHHNNSLKITIVKLICQQQKYKCILS